MGGIEGGGGNSESLWKSFSSCIRSETIVFMETVQTYVVSTSFFSLRRSSTV